MMNKNKQLKNVYLYFISKNFRYLSVEAIDDNGNKFEYTFNCVSHEDYLQASKNMCEQFEKFCKNTCGLYDSRYCDIWTLGEFSPIPSSFEYEDLFDKSTIHTKDYQHNIKIHEKYIKYNLDRIIRGCDWACGEFLSAQYYTKNNHIKNPEPYELFLEKHLTEKNACGVKAIVSVYREQIDKKTFSKDELKNIKTYMLDNIDMVFDGCFLTQEKIMTYFALSEAAVRLYKHDNTAFQEIIHKLTDELNSRHYAVDTAFYRFISTFHEDYYETFNKPFDGFLSEHKFLPKFCSLEDRVKIREMIDRYEYRHKDSESEGFW
ncbi:MAG: hypothetical protein PUK83_00395 [Clostridia bacterium]|nr:hypothetical protein [Clostridia bacterium]MDY5263901.1 hypothetical protein [Eubacteriales bacterium]